MADKVEGLGRIISGDQFSFTLDGIATAAQMERLIRAVGRASGDSPGSPENKAAAIKRRREEAATKSTKNLSDAQRSLGEATLDLERNFDKFGSVFRSLKSGAIEDAFLTLSASGAKIGAGVSAVIGALVGYADQLTEGLQRGISGGVFDYAIMAKTAGVSLQQFGKAIAESGGAFASLGDGATNGAKQFAALVGEVRLATASVGNLGMTNAQLAEFTARQTKVAISQGFKGRQAQELVIKNSRDLAEELDTLANRTGKSVLEMAQAAMKLAQDPIVANFVQTAKQGGAEISKSVQQFAASLRGVFGELGDTLAADALKSAMGGLPFVITQSGKNMIMASSAVYSELERQAEIVRRGGKIGAEEQERLRDLIVQEVEARGDELRMLANLEGPTGDSARQLLALAEQANFYNTEAGRQRREEDKRAQEFNTQIRAFTANLQALAIPFLQFLNGIDWTIFIKSFEMFTKIMGIVLYPLSRLSELLGSNSTLGTVIGGLFGLAGVIGLLYSLYGAYVGNIKIVTGALSRLAAMANRAAGAMANRGGAIGTVGRGAQAAGRTAGRFGGILGAGTLGLGMSGIFGGPETTAGTVGGIGAGIGGGILGSLGAGALGRAIGGGVGTFIGGPIGTAIGMALGGAVGSWLGGLAGDAMGGKSGDQMSKAAADAGSPESYAQATYQETQKQTRLLASLVDHQAEGNAIQYRDLGVSRDQYRATRELSYRSMG